MKIKIDYLPNGVSLTVRDNGKGIIAGSAKGVSTEKGIKIMEAYYRIFEKQYDCRIQTVFTDLQKTDPSLSGTEVSIRIEY